MSRADGRVFSRFLPVFLIAVDWLTLSHPGASSAPESPNDHQIISVALGSRYLLTNQNPR